MATPTEKKQPAASKKQPAAKAQAPVTADPAATQTEAAAGYETATSASDGATATDSAGDQGTEGDAAGGDVAPKVELDTPSKETKPALPGTRLVLIRTNALGVYVGRVVSWEKDTLKLSPARRIWEWGHQSLAGIAKDGPGNQVRCLAPLEEVTLKHANLSDSRKYELHDVEPSAFDKLGNHPVYRHS